MSMKSILLLWLLQLTVFALLKTYTVVPIEMLYIVIGAVYMIWFIASEGGLFNRLKPPPRGKPGEGTQPSKDASGMESDYSQFYKKLAVGIPFVLLPFLWNTVF